MKSDPGLLLRQSSISSNQLDEEHSKLVRHADNKRRAVTLQKTPLADAVKLLDETASLIC